MSDLVPNKVLLEEHKLDPEALRAKYDSINKTQDWSEHPLYDHAHWRSAVADEDTLQGYWEYVVDKIDEKVFDWDDPECLDPFTNEQARHTKAVK